MKANPQGRVDVLALSLAERLTRTHVNPQLGASVWDCLKPIAEQGIKAGMKALGVPKKNLLETPLGKVVADAFERTRVSGGAA